MLPKFLDEALECNMDLAERTFEGCGIYAAALDIPGSSGFHGRSS